MNHNILLKTQGLSKSFGDLKAVDNIDLEIESGGIVAIIGPNGAGKSTFINVLTGLIISDSGKIWFKKKDITKASIQHRVRIGINRSFQINSLFNDMTVKENILIPLLRWDMSPIMMLNNNLPTKIEERARELIASINMTDKMNIPVDKLSHGEQRLIEITLSVAKTPELLFLDEPTSGLSSSERTMVIDKINEIASIGTTVVLVEHNMDVVFSLAKRIVVLYKGTVLANDNPSNIKNNEEVKKVYLGG